MLSTQASTCLAGLLISSSGSRIGTHPGLQCPRNRSHPVARSHRRRTSLLSSPSHLVGVDVRTSRSIKPRERGLRSRSRLLFCPEILRGQPDFHDMPPAHRTISRNQYAPVFWEGATYGLRLVRQEEICVSRRYFRDGKVRWSGFTRGVGGKEELTYSDHSIGARVAIHREYDSWRNRTPRSEGSS